MLPRPVHAACAFSVRASRAVVRNTRPLRDALSVPSPLYLGTCLSSARTGILLCLDRPSRREYVSPLPSSQAKKRNHRRTRGTETNGPTSVPHSPFAVTNRCKAAQGSPGWPAGTRPNRKPLLSGTNAPTGTCTGIKNQRAKRPKNPHEPLGRPTRCSSMRPMR